MGRLAQTTDSTAWSHIPGCSAARSWSAAKEAYGARTDGGEFYVVGPMAGRWTLRVRRDRVPNRADDQTQDVVAICEGQLWHGNPQDVLPTALGRGEAMSWSIDVLPPGTPAGKAWLLLRRVIPAGSTVLRVEVVDSTLAGRVGVPYALVFIGAGTQKYLTGEDGQVQVVGLAPGPCVVRVEAIGWEIQPADTVVLVSHKVRMVRHMMRGNRPLVKE